MRWTTASVGATTLIGLALACSTEDPPPARTNDACQAIASACHSPGKSGGLPRECHDLGHAGDEAACAARESACLAACPDAPPLDDGGGAIDGGASDGSSTDPACAAYCTCLAGACTAIAGYPFAAPGSCASACAAQSVTERACLRKWCAKAESSKGVHDCEHAWGKLGLDECDSL